MPSPVQQPLAEERSRTLGASHRLESTSDSVAAVTAEDVPSLEQRRRKVSEDGQPAKQASGGRESGGQEPARRLRAAEFFAGIGLSRLGLSAEFDVVWANDIEPAKAKMYRQQFGLEGAEDDHLVVESVVDLADSSRAVLPPDLDLAWASSPCIDLSLAGNRAGLDGHHSSTFYAFTKVIDKLGEGHRPTVVVLENVVGLATSHGGDDLAAAIKELNRLHYSVDVLTLDARRFVPQSRPRLFLVGMNWDVFYPKDVSEPNSELRPDWLQAPYGDSTLTTHRAPLPAPPTPKTAGLSSPEFIERLSAADERWWDAKRTAAFTGSLSPIQAARLDGLRAGRQTSYRTAYRRTRNGVATWEIRPDDISGCLRTARGGSSKQAVVVAGRGQVRVRWMTPVEYARLMGAPDYKLDGIGTNQALFGFGDAVCVPAVNWLSTNYLARLANRDAEFERTSDQAAASA